MDWKPKRLSAALVSVPLVSLPKGQPRLVSGRQGELAVRLAADVFFRDHVQSLPRPELNRSRAKRRAARRQRGGGKLSTRRSIEASMPQPLSQDQVELRAAYVHNGRSRADRIGIPSGLLVSP